MTDKTDILIIRIEPGLKRHFKVQAKLEGMSASEFVRQAIQLRLTPPYARLAHVLRERKAKQRPNRKGWRGKRAPAAQRSNL